MADENRIVIGRAAKDLTGKRFGRLTAQVPVGRTSKKSIRWKCKCECGRSVVVVAHNLLNGHTSSCGCFRMERIHAKFDPTSPCHHPLNQVWRAMWSRCTNPKNTRFHRYGGRGIVVCERWSSFHAFVADMGPRPSPKHSIDRIDNDGPYSPENCRWATGSEQSLNRRNSISIQLNGVKVALKDLSRMLGINYYTLMSRYKRGWNHLDLLKTPSNPGGRHACETKVL